MGHLVGGAWLVFGHIPVTHLPLKDHSSKPNLSLIVLLAEMGRGEGDKGREGEGEGAP